MTPTRFRFVGTVSEARRFNKAVSSLLMSARSSVILGRDKGTSI